MSPDEADSHEDSEPDPPSLGPEVPSVDVPEVETSYGNAGDSAEPETTEFTGETDPEVVQLFWRLVVILDVGFAALALGPMFIYFEGNWNRGLLLTGFGVVVLAYGVAQFRRYQARESDDGDGERQSSGAEGDADPPAADGDGDDVADPKPATDDPKV